MHRTWYVAQWTIWTLDVVRVMQMSIVQCYSTSKVHIVQCHNVICMTFIDAHCPLGRCARHANHVVTLHNMDFGRCALSIVVCRTMDNARHANHSGCGHNAQLCCGGVGVSQLCCGGVGVSQWLWTQCTVVRHANHSACPLCDCPQCPMCVMQITYYVLCTYKSLQITVHYKSHSATYYVLCTLDIVDRTLSHYGQPL